MRNFQKELEKIIEENEKNGVVPSLLLHSCCAPCSSYCLEYLSDHFKITVLYYNPNLYPCEEYERRVGEQRKLVSALPSKYPISLVEEKGDPKDFFSAVKGLENIKEGGERCFACFKLRLERAAKFAKENAFDYFTTTLTISPLKNAQKLNEIGEAAGEKFGVAHLPSDFKKKNGYKRSVELSKLYGLYRQDYCGCVFSKKEREEAEKEKERKSINYQDINAETIDSWVKDGWEWGKPISHETFEKAKNGEWNVLLTPTKFVPHDWFGELKGKKVLGLASGGGQQMPVFSALGADCTVLDYSVLQLESERKIAGREGYEINIVRADMSKPLPFENESFDLIFHPVSNIYVKEVLPIWRECFRVLKKGGVLLSGLDNGICYAFDNDEKELRFTLPFDPIENGEHRKFLEADNSGFQFSHTLEEQLGGQLKAGFVLTDLFEDTSGEGNLHEHNVPTFIATRAMKK